MSTAPNSCLSRRADSVSVYPSRVTCKHSTSLALNGETRATSQVTPLGFLRGTRSRGEPSKALRPTPVDICLREKVSERVLKMVISTLTLLYKEPNYYKWIGCKRIQFVILPI